MLRARARIVPGRGWSLVLADLAALLLCFFALAVALTPPAPARVNAASDVAGSDVPATKALDSAAPSPRPRSEPAYVEALLRERLGALGAGLVLGDGSTTWLLRWPAPADNRSLERLLDSVAPLPVAVTLTLVTTVGDIAQQEEQRRAFALELGRRSTSVLVTVGSLDGVEVRFALR